MSLKQSLTNFFIVYTSKEMINSKISCNSRSRDIDCLQKISWYLITIWI